MNQKKAGQRQSPQRTSSNAKAAVNATTGQLGSKTDGDRAWKIAQLAATLATRYSVPHDRPHHGLRNASDWYPGRYEADPELDPIYISLLRRAEFLLNLAGARFGQIHAHALFDPKKRYTVGEITREFKLAGWARLTSDNSVRSLLKDVKTEIQDRTNEQLAHILRLALIPGYPTGAPKLTPKKRSEIEAEISKLLNDPDIIDERKDLTADIKKQIFSIRWQSKTFHFITGGDKPEKGILASALFGRCADMKVADDRLWRHRSELSQSYPL